MSIRDFTTTTMVAITGRLVDPERERSVLEKYPRLLPWLADIEEAHRGLYEVESNPTAPSAELVAMNEQATLLDSAHDRKVRGLHQAISGLADLSDNTDHAARFITLRDELFPSGRSIVNRSYIDQAGEASLVDARLSGPSRDLLRDTVIDGVTLLEYVEAWRTIAEELGNLEAKRIRRAKDEKAQTLVTISKARRAWIDTMNAVLLVIDREKSLTDDDRRRLLEPLETALAKNAAKKRAGARKTEPEPEAEAAVEIEAEPAE